MAAALGLLLSGCSGVPSDGPPANAAVTQTIIAAESALGASDYRGAGELYREAALATRDLAVVENAAEVAFEYGRTDDAEAILSHWQALAPDAAEPAMFLGRLHLRGGRLDASAGQFARFVEISPEPEAAVFDRLSQVLLRDGSAAAALSVATDLRDRYAGQWYAQRLLSRVAMRADERNLAMEAAELAYELAPDSFEAGLLQAQAILVGGDRAAGLDFAAEVAERASEPEEWLEYAGLLAAAEETAEATEIVERVVSERPNDADGIRALAALKLRSGDVDEAWAGFSELARLPDGQHDALYYLAGIAESQERTAQALRLYRQVGDGVHAVGAQQRISQLLLRTEGPEAALEHLQSFSLRKPELGFRLLLPRATLLTELGRTDEALAIYDDILELRPKSEPVMLTRAQTLLDADELDRAIAQYRAALTAHPDSALSLNALGYTLADRTEEFDEARVLIERALELAPDNAAIIDSMGWVLFKQGELEQARVHLERAWSMIKDPEVAAHLGETLWRLGEKEEARAILKEAYDRAPNSKPLRETLKRLLREEGQVTS